MPSIVANGREIEAAVPCTLDHLLAVLALPARSVVVEQNGEPVVPSEFGRRQVSAGDRLEIVRIVAGG